MIVTADRDFIAHAYAHMPHFGVILLQRADSVGNYVEYLETMALVMDANALRNQLIFYDW